MQVKITLSKHIGFDDNGKQLTEEKTYIAPPPMAIMVRRAAEIMEKTNDNELTTEDLDRLVDFVVCLFAKQFTADDYYNGVTAENSVAAALDVMHQVSAAMRNKLAQLPNAQTEAVGH